VELVERDRALSALVSRYDACVAGQAGVVLVRGPAGAGKSALLRVFGERVTASGGLLLQATVASAESGLPLSVIGQLLHGVDLSAADTCTVAGLLEKASGEIGTVELSALCRVLLAQAKQRPMVLFVDDVHHADPYSQEFLRYLAHRLDTPRVLLVLSESSSHPGVPNFQAELFHLPRCLVINVGLLSPQGVAELAAGTGLGLDAVSLYDVSGGNPLLTRALLEDHRVAAAETPPAEVVAGEVFAVAVEICLYRGDAEARRTAWAAVVLGPEATRARIAEVLGSPPQIVDRSMAALVEMGLLLPGDRFRHEAVRAAVERRMDHHQRARLETRAASVLHDHGAPTTVVARHLVAAERIDAPWVLPTLREGAELALAEDDVDLALDCLRVARDICTDESQSLEIKAALVRAAWRVNPTMAAHYLPELAEAAARGRLEIRDVRVVIGCLLWFGRTGEAVRLLEAVAKEASGQGGESALVQLWMIYGYPGLPGVDRSQSVEKPLAPLTPVRSPSLRARALLATVVTKGRDDEIAVRAEQILQTTPLNDHTATVIVAALIALIVADRPLTASSWCMKLEKEAVRRRSPVWQALFVTVRALIDVMIGRLAEAAETARSALELVPAQGWGVVVAVPLSVLVYAEAMLGEYEKAAERLTVPVPEAAFETPGGVLLLWARGRFHLATGNAYAALDDFHACGELMGKWGVDLPSFVPWRTDAAEAYLQLGDTKQARVLVEEQLDLLGTERTWMRGVALRVLASACEPAERLPLLQEAVEILHGRGHQLKEAQALEELGRTHRRLGQEKQARSMMRKAQRLLRDLGVGQQLKQGVTSGADNEPEREPAPVEQENPLGLSDAEFRVASLAAVGQSNREIAEALFITLSTVEQHMTRIFRKLGVRRRGDLESKLLGVSDNFYAGNV
jgi:DNA-binding CsgD family transcriptional regulator